MIILVRQISAEEYIPKCMMNEIMESLNSLLKYFIERVPTKVELLSFVFLNFFSKVVKKH